MSYKLDVYKLKEYIEECDNDYNNYHLNMVDHYFDS